LATAAGTPANFGKVGDAGRPYPTSDEGFTYLWTALADADPLGVNQNVTFDEVGGLDDRLSFHLSFITVS
jgi:ATPase family AAA domain-containing protein 2